MARLYADENFPLPVVEALRAAGHDVHFIRLHRENSNHAGIVICTFDRDFAGQAARIDGELRSVETLIGQLIRIHRPWI